MEIYQETTVNFPQEITCPSCRNKLLLASETTRLIACPRCLNAISLDENQEITDFKKIPFKNLLDFFPDNSSVKEMVATRKEKILTRYIWLLMFIILLLVSWIMY